MTAVRLLPNMAATSFTKGVGNRSYADSVQDDSSCSSFWAETHEQESATLS